MKIKTILVSQPEPTDKSPYHEIAQKHGVKIDFKPFIKVERVSVKDFRKNRVNILDHSAIIFTSKTAIDHFFNLCEELKVVMPDDMKYFCITESVAFYLQKYIVYRKRKIFYGKNTFDELMDVLQKHKTEFFFLPVSDISTDEIPVKLEKAKYKFSKIVLYRTVSENLSALKLNDYDIVVFFSPAGVKALFENFPDFKQDEKIIAAFGPVTNTAVLESGLKLNIKAPTPEAPSMTMALDQFILKNNKKTNGNGH